MEKIKLNCDLLIVTDSLGGSSGCERLNHFINWRSIIQMINLQTMFGELDPPQALKFEFSAKNNPAKSSDILSTFNGSSSAAEGGKRLVSVRQFNGAMGLDRVANANSSHLHIDSHIHMPPFCSIANHFWKQRFELDRVTLATRTARRNLCAR